MLPNISLGLNSVFSRYRDVLGMADYSLQKGRPEGGLSFFALSIAAEMRNA